MSWVLNSFAALGALLDVVIGASDLSVSPDPSGLSWIMIGAVDDQELFVSEQAIGQRQGWLMRVGVADDQSKTVSEAQLMSVEVNCADGRVIVRSSGRFVGSSQFVADVGAEARSYDEDAQGALTVRWLCGDVEAWLARGDLRGLDTAAAIELASNHSPSALSEYRWSILGSTRSQIVFFEPSAYGAGWGWFVDAYREGDELDRLAASFLVANCESEMLATATILELNARFEVLDRYSLPLVFEPTIEGSYGEMQVELLCGGAYRNRIHYGHRELSRVYREMLTFN